MKKCILLFCLALFLTKLARAQEGFEIREKVGFLAAHHAGMAHLPQQLGIATELSYVKKLNGEKQWHSAYRNPKIGRAHV